MGIQGLLPLLKSIQAQIKLSELAGKTLAVDGYVWLHKGAYGCATELVTGKATTKYIDYAMHRIRLLRHYGIEPYLVFDGGPLPAKRGTEIERRKQREGSLMKAEQLASRGRHGEARDLYAKCVDITPKHAFQLIKALRAEAVPYVVAPYEADAQLAYLEKSGTVHGILTEDSDLLVFGCKNVYFKLDVTTFTVTHIARSKFSQVTDINLALWTDADFRHMAMMSGCDYLEGLKGVGVRTANKLLRKYKSLERALKFIALESSTVRIPNGYLEAFQKAELAFLYQRVYDCGQKRLVHLSELPSTGLSEENDLFVGRELSEELAQRIATGDYCPLSHEPIIDINPSYQPDGRGKQKSVGLTSNARLAVKSGPMDRFLAAKTKIPPPKQTTSTAAPTLRVNTGASGTRSLSGEVEKIEDTRARRKESIKAGLIDRPSTVSSRFFSDLPIGSTSNQDIQGPSSKDALESAQEEETDEGARCGTLVLQIDGEELELLEVAFEPDDIVEQEKGYRSPSPSLSIVDASSIASPEDTQQSNRKMPTVDSDGDDEDGWGEGDDVLSSPIKPPPPSGHLAKTLPTSTSVSDNSTAADEPLTLPDADTQSSIDGGSLVLTPDLQELFSAFEGGSGSNPSKHSQSVPKPKTGQKGAPRSPIKDSVPETDIDAVAESDYERSETVEQTRKEAAVALAWRKRYSFTEPNQIREVMLSRKQTTLSAIAQRRQRNSSPKSSQRSRSKGPLQPLNASLPPKRKLAPRKSEPLLAPLRISPFRPPATGEDEISDEEHDASRIKKRRRISMPQRSEPARLCLVDEEELVARSKSRLQSFRYTADVS